MLSFSRVDYKTCPPRFSREPISQLSFRSGLVQAPSGRLGSPLVELCYLRGLRCCAAGRGVKGIATMAFSSEQAVKTTLGKTMSPGMRNLFDPYTRGRLIPPSPFLVSSESRLFVCQHISLAPFSGLFLCSLFCLFPTLHFLLLFLPQVPLQGWGIQRRRSLGSWKLLNYVLVEGEREFTFRFISSAGRRPVQASL